MFYFRSAIHDQGAGGNGNVLKELVEPEGGVVFTKEFQLGDPTITTLELWGAEYQENDALLCSKEQRSTLEGELILDEWLNRFRFFALKSEFNKSDV